MKHIGYFCSTLNHAYMIGCNRYTQCLLHQVDQMLSKDQAQWTLFGPTPAFSMIEKFLGRKAQPLELNQDFHRASAQPLLDLLHLLTDAPIPHLGADTPYIVTCHGVTPFHVKTQTESGRLPGSYWDYQDLPEAVYHAYHSEQILPKLKWLFYKRKILYQREQSLKKWFSVLQNARKVIAVSDFVKSEILEHCKIPESQIRVIHEAADESFGQVANEEKIQSVLRKYRLPRKFVLSVTNMHLVKNIHGQFALAKFLKDKIPAYKFVHAYLGSAYEERYLKIPQDFNVRHEVDYWLLRDIPQDDLKVIYQAAHLFINMAWIETFGLPIVEAMKAGLPIVSSDRCALAEVVGSGGITSAPQDQERFFSLIAEVLVNENLRQELIAKSKQRGAFFTWQKTAKETISVYEEVLNKPLM